MLELTEERAVKLKWADIAHIISAEIANILGHQIECRAYIVDEYWEIFLVGCRMPLHKLCLLLQAVHATPDEWEESLPEEGEASVGSLGMSLASKLLGRHISCSWRHQLITEDSLWLVGVTEDVTPKMEYGSTIYTVVHTATDVDIGRFQPPAAVSSYLSLSAAQAEMEQLIAAEKSKLDERYDHEELGSDYWEISQCGAANFSRFDILTTKLEIDGCCHKDSGCAGNEI